MDRMIIFMLRRVKKEDYLTRYVIVETFLKIYEFSEYRL